MSNSTCDVFSIRSNTMVPRPPNLCSAKPNNTENNNTCKISPFGKSIDHRGRNDVEQKVHGALHLARCRCRPQCPWYPATRGLHACRNAGCNKLTTTRPMMSATVDTTSKYRSARPPVLPTFFMSSMPAIPTTTVQKMMGAMIILINLMKASPSGFMSAPVREKWPRNTAECHRGEHLDVKGFVERFAPGSG